MTLKKMAPLTSYGILQQNEVDSPLLEAIEQIKNIGYAVIDSGYSLSEINTISEKFNSTRSQYIKLYKEEFLKSMNEFYTIRALLTHNEEHFLKLSLNKNIISILKILIPGKFILNQQNGIINPPQETYNQNSWHRDIPYQHFITSQPLAINALFCLDDFTIENGATFVLPASHKIETLPSYQYIQKNSMQIEAKAGSFILLDCMLYHAGGFNQSHHARRAINHVYNIPFFKQQINLPMNMNDSYLSIEEKDILGFNYKENASIEEYFSSRINRQ